MSSDANDKASDLLTLLNLVTTTLEVLLLYDYIVFERWRESSANESTQTVYSDLPIRARRVPLTAAQTTAFFEHADQMGIPNKTVVQLVEEGIDTVDDLVDFEKDTIEQIAANLRRPAGRVPDPNPAAAAVATVPTPPFVLGAKSQQRLINAAKLIRYYDTVGRNVTAGKHPMDSGHEEFL
jgi:hypothetical protein